MTQKELTAPKINTNLDIRFDNRFADTLPADPNRTKQPRQVFGAAYSRVDPTPVADPQLVAHSQEVADLLGLSADFVQSDDFVQIFAGNQLIEGMDPYAMCYGGHQFGNWAGQLGDGRAINLGELVNPAGEHWTLQLKGAGLTPYSRTADGLAVLRSSIREFLCSEAMFHLGVPTTRALSLVTTGEKVVRDMFYNGNPAPEHGAIVCRVAPSFTRFGNFQLFAARQDQENLKKLVDHTITADFPHLGEPNQETYIQWFHEICTRTAEMIVHWMRVGFVHGVMNTDNMSILGLTIDYGPYGWLEDYNPKWTPNTTDAQHKRYRFENQPQTGMWNLAQLGNALIGLLDGEVEPLQAGINLYGETFSNRYSEMMGEKLGFAAYQKEVDEPLLEQLQVVLMSAETDMTIFYRKLADLDVSDMERTDEEWLAPIFEAYYQPEQLTADVQSKIADWLRNYAARVRSDRLSADERRQKMNAVNPKYVLRNYMAQVAIDGADSGDSAVVHELHNLLKNPYDEQPEMEKWAAKRPEWARHRPGSSMLSCSS